MIKAATKGKAGNEKNTTVRKITSLLSSLCVTAWGQPERTVTSQRERHSDHTVAKHTDRSDVMCSRRDQCCWKRRVGATGGHWWIGKVQIWWSCWLTWATQRFSRLHIRSNLHSCHYTGQLTCTCHILALAVNFQFGDFKFIHSLTPSLILFQTILHFWHYNNFPKSNLMFQSGRNQVYKEQWGPQSEAQSRLFANPLDWLLSCMCAPLCPPFSWTACCARHVCCIITIDVGSIFKQQSSYQGTVVTQAYW